MKYFQLYSKVYNFICVFKKTSWNQDKKNGNCVIIDYWKWLLKLLKEKHLHVFLFSMI